VQHCIYVSHANALSHVGCTALVASPVATDEARAPTRAAPAPQLTTRSRIERLPVALITLQRRLQVCRTYADDGFCPYGSRCRFVHEASSDGGGAASAPGGATSGHAPGGGAPRGGSRSPHDLMLGGGGQHRGAQKQGAPAPQSNAAAAASVPQSGRKPPGCQPPRPKPTQPSAAGCRPGAPKPVTSDTTPRLVKQVDSAGTTPGAPAGPMHNPGKLTSHPLTPFLGTAAAVTSVSAGSSSAMCTRDQYARHEPSPRAFQLALATAGKPGAVACRKPTMVPELHSATPKSAQASKAQRTPTLPQLLSSRAKRSSGPVDTSSAQLPSPKLQSILAKAGRLLPGSSTSSPNRSPRTPALVKPAYVPASAPSGLRSSVSAATRPDKLKASAGGSPVTAQVHLAQIIADINARSATVTCASSAYAQTVELATVLRRMSARASTGAPRRASAGGRRRGGFSFTPQLMTTPFTLSSVASSASSATCELDVPQSAGQTMRQTVTLRLGT
jgi:Zinc finger C-x8-C-x5-C-x3-H type (and similar)